MSEVKQLPVITISREYGAGGRSVARALSSKLGLEFYDIDFVKLTAKASGYSEEDVRNEGEEISGGLNFLNSFLPNTASFTNSYDKIYEAQCEVVMALAKKPCIIVGRCANVILREAGIPSFDVFLYADKAFRLERAAQLKENGDMDLEKYLEQRDHWRRNYFKKYAKREIGDYALYNICLDTGTIGFDQCVDIISRIVENMAQ